MGVTDEQDKLVKVKPPLLPKPCTSSSAGSGEHVIPQMVITSADDVSSEIQDASGSVSAPTSPPCESLLCNVQAEGEVAEDLLLEQKQEQSHETSNILEDSSNLSQPKGDVKSSDSVAHTVVQRPLIIESEKSIYHLADDPTEEDSKYSSEHASSPSPVPSQSSVSPTTMQRPLVIDSSVSVQTEVVISPSSEETVISSLSKQDFIKTVGEPQDDLLERDKCITPEVDESSVAIDSKAKSTSFSWVPTFPKLHAGTKEPKSTSQDQIEKNRKSIEESVLKQEEASNIKKEGVSNVKKFFDSFKHDVPQETKDKAALDEIKTESPTKETTKEAMQSFKKIFSSSKVDSAAEKDKNIHSKTIEEHADHESKSFAKDARHNIRTFFDSFKPDISEEKNRQSIQEDTVVPDAGEKCDETHKESKHNFKKFFTPSKSESVVGEEKKAFSDISEVHEQEQKSSFAKDAKQNIKTFFDSFKPDVTEQKTKNVQIEIASSESNKVCDDVLKAQSKESKHGIKKFFDSFKHDATQSDDIAVPSKLHEPDSDNVVTHKQDIEQNAAKSDGEIKECDKDGMPNFKKMFESFIHPDQKEAKEWSHRKFVVESKESSENSKEVSKENVQGVKKFFDSFKHDIPSAEKGDGMKSTGDVKSLEEIDKKPKDSLHNIKHFFDSFKKEVPDVGSEDAKVEHLKAKGLKRSQSCKESATDKEGLRSVKSFFESFSHKSIAKVSSQPQELNSKGEIKLNEHIYDVVEAPAILVTTYSQKESAPKDTEVCKKLEKKQRDGAQTPKKMFDSFLHKDPTPKPKPVEKSENIYDKVTPQPTVSVNNNATISSDKEKEPESKEPKDSLQGVKKFIDSFMHKESPKAALNESSDNPPLDIVETKNEPPLQTHESPGSSYSKPSVFTSIGENILSIKDKVLHSKDTKKSEVVLSDSSKFEEYDLENAAKSKNNEHVTGTFRVLDDFAYPSTKTGEKFMNDGADKPQNIKESNEQAAVPEPKASEVKSSKKKACLEPGTPETLYDTCCLKIATLLRDKAIEIVADKTKSPPKKPPKPSAEAIAKARAATVSKRLQDMRGKGQSLGENIPVGYEGIRFADDETESSCDYKDVENFDYIMDYELINRYKFDNKVDTFSVPSTCSGMTSYYTADTITLRDENFSDAALETVSLGSSDSYRFRSLSSSHSKSDGKIVSPPAPVEKVKEEKKQHSIFKFPSFRKEAVKSESKSGSVSHKSQSPITSQSTAKKIPPPLPPKPVLSPKHTGVASNVSKSSDKSPSSSCINGLSLSPRLQTKFAKDSAGTQKRPLMVAGVKETEFTSLQPKSKDFQTKQLKDRRFDTVLKNESLKSITNVSSSHPSLVSTKSSPAELIASKDNVASLQRKISPQRPPPPLSAAKQEATKSHMSIISSSTKASCESPSAEPVMQKEKRTVSPPRPPPPVFKKSACPPRPPPPVIPSKSSEDSGDHDVEQQHTELKKHECKDPCINLKETDSCPYCTKKESIKEDSVLSLPGQEMLSHESTMDASLPYEENKTIKADSPNVLEDSSPKANMEMGEISSAFDNIPPEKPLANFVQECATIVEKAPKPPPRIRRIRSRTVEVVPEKKITEPRLRRSQSLSDIDIEKRVNSNISPESADIKSLYTIVNKDVKKIICDDSTGQEENSLDLERVSSRPLPAPPPPPRKFRSLDRQDRKSAKQKIKDSDIKTSENLTVKCSSCDLDVKPPARKKKAEKPRFHSLDSEKRIEKYDPTSKNISSKISRSSSVPLKPERKLKHVVDSQYDENANVTFPVVEVHYRSPQLDECGNEILDSTSTQNIPFTDTVDSIDGSKSEEKNANPESPLRKIKNPKSKSHSSWYDENEPLEEESWEIVDWSHRDDFESRLNLQPRIPMRRKSDPVKKTRQTSTFYIDVEQEREFLPLVDKETSPLPLDCSEKSVQTSLETLSQGIASRDEQSEDTDELLDLAQTLQNELKVIINRHKSATDDYNDDSNTPPVSASDSEKHFDEKLCGIKKIPSVRSSASELWPMSSSEESDGEIGQLGSTNLTEVALTRKQKKIFYIAQEIMTSEEIFVDALKLLNVDFKAAVDFANKEKNTAVIPDDVLYQILNHLPQLQHLNENLLMELKDRIENWGTVGKIADIIVKMGPFLKLYSWYIHDFESNLSLLEESKKKYPLFAQVVKDFEISARCKRLALNHYMLKPIQRIPQYRLLLQEYLHHLPEDSPDYQDTVAALQIVSEVANHANESMKQGDNAQKLISIQNSIIGHKEIIKPGRLFVKEGELMKLSRKGMQPRWFVLFNDLLLYLTPVQQGLYRVNHELPLTGMKVAIPIQQDYQNEFSIISVTRSFTLAARSQEERQEWIIALTKAIEENASKRSTFTNIRLQQRAQGKSSEEEEGAFILGRKAPVWIPDARVTMCQLCTSEFTVTFRRHHCRACGKVVCSICSSNRISLPYLGNRIARVCDECHTRLGPGSSGCTESGETDSDNQQLAVKSHLRTESKHIKHRGRRNLPSVLKEVCANDQGSTISGYLQKRSGKSWKRDWFVVKDKVLYEYKASEDVAALRSVPLLGYQIESFSEPYENVEPSLLFQLTHPGQSPIIFHTDTVSATERWVAALKEASVLE